MSEVRLLVTRLPETFTVTNLAELFAPYGVVRGVQLLRAYGDSMQPCAYVIMSTLGAALTAINCLHRKFTPHAQLKSIHVYLAVREAERLGLYMLEPPGSVVGVVVRRLPCAVDPSLLESVMAQHGEVDDVNLFPRSAQGHMYLAGLVTFTNPAGANRAVAALNRVVTSALSDSPLEVTFGGLQDLPADRRQNAAKRHPVLNIIMHPSK